MHIMFSPGEVFDIAIQIERNGYAYYKKAAALATDPVVKAELEELAAMEDGHESAFEKLKNDVLGPEKTEWFEPESEAMTYMNNFAAGSVFDMSSNPGDWLTPETTFAEVLARAIDLERNAVLFYVGMKRLIPEDLGVAKLQPIIDEEMSHITLLNDRLKRLSA